MLATRRYRLVDCCWIPANFIQTGTGMFCSNLNEVPPGVEILSDVDHSRFHFGFARYWTGRVCGICHPLSRRMTRLRVGKERFYPSFCPALGVSLASSLWSPARMSSETEAPGKYPRDQVSCSLRWQVSSLAVEPPLHLVCKALEA